jgi:hypothetical protein
MNIQFSPGILRSRRPSECGSDLRPEFLQVDAGTVLLEITLNDVCSVLVSPGFGVAVS